MRIDAHQHFIDYNSEEYPWMGEAHQTLKRKFLPEHLKPLLDANGFDAAIAVQARQMLKETQWLLELAEQHDWIKGVVGWVELCSPQVEEQLAALSKHRKLKGVRHVLHDEPDDQFMLRPEFQRGISKLAEFGLTYDLLIFEHHLPIALTLVDAFPEQPFVLDHIAKPNMKERKMSSWHKYLKALAKRQNVYCKLSGMVTEANWKQWREADFKPYLDVVFEAFGEDRLMIGSDWPVCTLSGEYAAVMNIVKNYIAALPLEVQEKVLGGNCSRFYGVEA